MNNLYIAVQYHYPVIYRSSDRSKINRVADRLDTIRIKLDTVDATDAPLIYKVYDKKKFVKDKIKALFDENYVRIGQEFWEVSHIPCYRVIQTGPKIADFFLSHQIYKDEPNTFLPEQRELAIKTWTDVICSGPAPMRPQQPKANIIVVK